MPANDTRRKHVEQVEKAAHMAAGLTRQLLTFSRKQVIEPRVLKLNDVITDVEKMLRRLIGEDIEFHTKLDPAAGHIKADAGQIEQVIMNLAVQRQGCHA
jgi:signal transduction histidine kinase